MENVPNGELFELLASAEPSVAGKPVSEGTMRRFLRNIIDGMAECYRCGITHRDLKPENLLINEEGTIVIIDLGHAKLGEPVQNLNRQSDGNLLPPPPPLMRTSTANAYGTEAFNAPEVSSGIKYDCELSDVWSIGVIAFYLHAKLPAFRVGGGAGVVDALIGEQNEPFWSTISKSGWYPAFPEGLKEFINVLWRVNPDKRPRFADLERAITGAADIIEKYPGLKWLADPVNDATSFISELRASCPTKTFRNPEDIAAPPPPAAGATRW
jgi:serine/threonine protein kinase